MTDEAAAPPPPKLDPETLALRGTPRRAIRFKRGAIIGIAAIGSASLMTIAWVALKPRVFQSVAQSSELSEPNNQPTSDTLSGLAANYGDVPKLGPPLPGDLGRPILAKQREIETGAAATDQSAQDAAQKRATELKAARESGVFAQTSNVPLQQPAAFAAAPAEAPQPGGESTPGTRSTKEAFLARQDNRGDVNPHELRQPSSRYLISAGSVIAASLITGVNSDIPGLITAQITQNVYDSPTGHLLLVPQGARLVGTYDSVVAFGQRRALIVWQRLIFADGRSLRIDNTPAADPAGYAGLADRVDFHTWSLLKGIGLATLLGVGTELTIDGESDLVEAVREATQRNAARAGDQLVQRNLDIQPTITIRPGAPVRLVVHKDLIVAPLREAGR